MGRWTILFIASAQAIALAVLINRFGFPTLRGPQDVADGVWKAIYKGSSLLGVDLLQCGFVHDEDVVLVSSRVVTPDGVIGAAGGS